MPIGSHGEGDELEALTDSEAGAGAGCAASGSLPSGEAPASEGNVGTAPDAAGGALGAPVLPELGTSEGVGTASKPGGGLVPPAGGSGTDSEGDTAVGVGWRGGGSIGSESPATATSTWPVTQTGVWSLEDE
jgi:hypothetical protein